MLKIELQMQHKSLDCLLQIISAEHFISEIISLY
jgi:hypothetical protein